MFKILSDEKRFELWEAYYSCQAVDVTKISYEQFLAKAEQKNTLKQVIEWGNEYCHNPEHIKISGVASQKKRLCYACWAELEKEVEGG